jgi:signal peptidase I
MNELKTLDYFFNKENLKQFQQAEKSEKTEAAKSTETLDYFFNNENLNQFRLSEKTEETETAEPIKTAVKAKSGLSLLVKDVLFLIAKIAFIALAFVLLFTFLFGFIRYQEPAMDPTVKDGDLAIFYRYTKKGYLPRDLVVLKYEGEQQIRRVIATAGDKVDITDDGGLMINGALQQEPGIYQETYRYEDGVEFPLTVPEGQIFVLADSRLDATDSRIYGCIDIEDTFGKVMTVFRRRNM